jgi:glycosyltransferase involved in cell wall biosynthesis
LAIAGNANYKSKFVEDLKQTRDPRVKFLGHIDDADHVKELHCNAYAYVHGHMMGGTNPALVKALGYGNFILALNTLFNAEVLADYGVLFDMDADSLARTMQHYEDHPELAASFRARAPQRIREAYTWEHITDQYEEYFYSLIEGKKPSHAAVAALKHQWATAAK